MNTLDIARSIVDVLEEKKGEDIILIDIHEIAIFASYFVICSGTSERMLKSLMDALNESIRDQYGLKARLEGETGDGWLLADYGDIIVHLFSPKCRNYYRLEELWSHGKVLVHLQ